MRAFGWVLIVLAFYGCGFAREVAPAIEGTASSTGVISDGNLRRYLEYHPAGDRSPAPGMASDLSIAERALPCFGELQIMVHRFSGPRREPLAQTVVVANILGEQQIRRYRVKFESCKIEELQAPDTNSGGGVFGASTDASTVDIVRPWVD